MIHIKRKIILVSIILTLAGIGAFGVASVYAQSPQGKYPSIVQKLVEKFGLKESDVQSVFDEAQQERQSQMQAKFEESLSQAVKDRKITEAQKQLILTKRQELKANSQANFTNMQNMTPDQRKGDMQAQNQALTDWAKQNSIDIKYLFGGHMGHFRGRKGGLQMMK